MNFVYLHHQTKTKHFKSHNHEKSSRQTHSSASLGKSNAR